VPSSKLSAPDAGVPAFVGGLSVPAESPAPAVATRSETVDGGSATPPSDAPGVTVTGSVRSVVSIRDPRGPDAPAVRAATVARMWAGALSLLVERAAGGGGLLGGVGAAGATTDALASRSGPRTWLALGERTAAAVESSDVPSRPRDTVRVTYSRTCL